MIREMLVEGKTFRDLCLEAKEYVKKWIVKSSSDLNKKYIVAQTATGAMECSCPAWIYQRKVCRHIRSVIEGEGIQVNPKLTARELFSS